MDAYDELLERLKDVDLIGQIGGLMGWDQEVLMPPKAAGQPIMRPDLDAESVSSTNAYTAIRSSTALATS